jgi:hypothetical protein
MACPQGVNAVLHKRSINVHRTSHDGGVEHEVKTTRKLLERLPQDKLGWRPHPKSHTAGELAFHIAMLPEFVTRFVLGSESPIPDEAVIFKQPTSVQEILSLHEAGARAVK